MTTLIATLIIIAFLFGIGFLILAYLNGAFEIVSREIVKSQTYNVSYRSHYTGNITPDGKKTHEVHKITYRNGRVKYKEYTFNH